MYNQTHGKVRKCIIRHMENWENVLEGNWENVLEGN